MKKKFKINCVVYQVLYKVLCHAVIKNYYKGNSKKFKSAEGSKLWDTFNQADFNKLLSGDRGTSNLYFYSKKFDLDPARIEEDVIDPIATYKALQYIGVDISSSVDYRTTGRVRLAELLLLEFQKLYEHEIEQLRDDYKDRRHRSSVATIEVDYKPLNGNIKGFNDESTKEIRIQLARELLPTYFDAINERNYRYVWDMYRSTGKYEQWDDDYYRKFTSAHEALIIKDYEIKWIRIKGPYLYSRIRVDYQNTHYSLRFVEKLKRVPVIELRTIAQVMRHVARRLVEQFEQGVLPSIGSISLGKLLSDDPAFEISKDFRGVTPEMVFGRPILKNRTYENESYSDVDSYQNEIETVVVRSKMFSCSCVFDGRRWLFDHFEDDDGNYMH